MLWWDSKVLMLPKQFLLTIKAAVRQQSLHATRQVRVSRGREKSLCVLMS